MPEPLVSFATDISRYQLNGENTLHDSWLKDLHIKKNYDQSIIKYSEVELCLLQASHRKEIKMTYHNVNSFNCSLKSERWIDRPVDLLLHEFSKINDNFFDML